MEIWNSLRCIANCLQPSINATLLSVSVINHIGSAKQLVGDFRNSVVAFEALKQPQEQTEEYNRKAVNDILRFHTLL